MSAFEDRVNAAASLTIDPLYKVLENLNPDIAKQYVIGINAINEENLHKKKHLTGFGGFAEHDVDDLMAIALGKGAKLRISRDDEEALMIILAASTPWKGKAKAHMIDLLEKNLKYDASSKSIASEAPQLLAPTNRLDFLSKGNKYQGTGMQYTPLEFQLIAGLIADDDVHAWEVSKVRTFSSLPEAKLGASSFYDPDTDDIYIVSGLPSRDRQCNFVHECVHAILDVRNKPRMHSCYIAADGYIAQAFVALSLGVPYAAFPDRPEETASRGASSMLLTAVRDRDAKWNRAFRDAYDDVVDACVTLRGSGSAGEFTDMLEDQTGQDAENAMVKKVLAKLKAKK